MSNNLRHPHHARVFVPKFDNLGEIVNRYQHHSDKRWYYAIRLDGGGTVYGLTDDDVRDRPDDTSEPPPPAFAHLFGTADASAPPYEQNKL